MQKKDKEKLSKFVNTQGWWWCDVTDTLIEC